MYLQQLFCLFGKKSFGRNLTVIDSSAFEQKGGHHRLMAGRPKPNALARWHRHNGRATSGGNWEIGIIDVKE